MRSWERTAAFFRVELCKIWELIVFDEKTSKFRFFENLKNKFITKQLEHPKMKPPFSVFFSLGFAYVIFLQKTTANQSQIKPIFSNFVYFDFSNFAKNDMRDAIERLHFSQPKSLRSLVWVQLFFSHIYMDDCWATRPKNEKRFNICEHSWMKLWTSQHIWKIVHEKEISALFKWNADLQSHSSIILTASYDDFWMKLLRSIACRSRIIVSRLCGCESFFPQFLIKVSKRGMSEANN